MPSDPRAEFKTLTITLAMEDDDDDFQDPKPAIALTQNLILSSMRNPKPKAKPLRPSNGAPQRKKSKPSTAPSGKENHQAPPPVSVGCKGRKGRTVERRGLGAADELRSLELSHFSKNDPTNLYEFCEKRELGAENAIIPTLKDEVVAHEVIERAARADALDNNDYSCLTQAGSPDGSVDASAKVLSIFPNELQNSYECGERREVVSEDVIFSTLMESVDCSEIHECHKNDKEGIDDLLNKQQGNAGMKGLQSQKSDYYVMSIESRLLGSGAGSSSGFENNCLDEDESQDFEAGTQLNELMKLCSEMNGAENLYSSTVFPGVQDMDSVGLSGFADHEHEAVECPLCGTNITNLSEELRNVHTNDCLDRDNASNVSLSGIQNGSSLHLAADNGQVRDFLQSLGLSRYEEAFAREEIDWDTLQWLTEEDLLSIGVVALGPRKKIVHALKDLRGQSGIAHDTSSDTLKASNEENAKVASGNKLITEYFPGSSINKSRASSGPSIMTDRVERKKSSVPKRTAARTPLRSAKLRDIPSWCCIPGTPFRVDAFRFLRGDCSHWFLSHFHIDHYQGLTKNFRHGKIYCSSITAKLINTKIGIPCDRIHALPLGQKIKIDGIDVTCLDANHCPGSIIILFEPPNGKAVLHTGDFRFCEAMTSCSILQSCCVHTLILDTTYCNPQYDFPKQEAVIQFVIEAIQAEAFNPKTLFLIGSYTVGKERLFLEVARFLRKKVYVEAAKLRLLQCLGFSKEDMEWFTVNEMESNIHVVPMWTIASFKRMKHISNQYSGCYNLIVAFSPTGWTFGKGKKRSPGKRWQQGTIIRYEVPYSEHSSFSELREFVQLLSPDVVIPSVNNTGPESADSMVALLVSNALYENTS